jgi:hypothetical protein
VQGLGVDVRAGIDVGKANVINGKIGGLVVHIGARITVLAAPTEVLVSRTLAELVPGSGFRFEDRGVRMLRGVPGQHHVLAMSGLNGEDRPGSLDPDEAAARREAITPRSSAYRPGCGRVSAPHRVGREAARPVKPGLQFFRLTGGASLRLGPCRGDPFPHLGQRGQLVGGARRGLWSV